MADNKYSLKHFTIQVFQNLNMILMNSLSLYRDIENMEITYLLNISINKHWCTKNMAVLIENSGD